MGKVEKVIAVVQARMGSTRLPQKVLLNFHEIPIFKWVSTRVSMAKKVDDIVFAIPDHHTNDPLYEVLKKSNINIFRGAENDVLDRFLRAAEKHNANTVIRICCDNPLICGEEIDRLIDYYNDNKCDYAYNHIPKNNNYPDGLGAEICNISLLQSIDKLAKKESQREHLFNYIWDNSDDFIIKTFNAPSEIAYPSLKLDVDTLTDYENLLNKPFNIKMSALEIVKTALL
jgi:spore coat polysaccharide biosynthesis protein SpsF